MSNSEGIDQLFEKAKLLDQKSREAFEMRDKDAFENSVNEAIITLNKILELAPGSPEAHYWLGNKHFEIRQFTESLQNFDTVLEILKNQDPNADLFIECRVNRTGSLCEMERFDEAIKECDSIMEEYKEHKDSVDINKSCGWKLL